MPYTVNPDHGYLEGHDRPGGGGVDIQQINVDTATPPGTDPVLADGSGAITLTGGQVSSGTVGANVIRTHSQAANSLTIEVQQSASVASEDTSLNGVSHFNSSQFTVSNGFVSLAGGGTAIDSVNVDTSTAPGTDPVAPDINGQITVTGGQVSSGTVGANVIRTNSLSANAYTIEIQQSTTSAVINTGLNGVAHFNSDDFTVSSGFVSLSGSGVGQTITGDSGGALSPTAGNWNILGLSGSKTSGSGSSLTIKSPPYADQAGSTTVLLNSGSFATNAITLTTPATAALADGDLLEFVATNGVLVIQLAATQMAHLGSASTTAAGTITGSATGDSISLRYQASTNDWWATSSIGIWTLA
jgi:hypothetical protein